MSNSHILTPLDKSPECLLNSNDHCVNLLKSYIILFAFLEDVVLSHAHSLHDQLNSLQVDISILCQVALQTNTGLVISHSTRHDWKTLNHTNPWWYSLRFCAQRLCRCWPVGRSLPLCKKQHQWIIKDKSFSVNLNENWDGTLSWHQSLIYLWQQQEIWQPYQQLWQVTNQDWIYPYTNKKNTKEE